MIEFVILNADKPDATLLEFVRVIVGYDMSSAYYDGEPRQFTPNEIEGLWNRAGKMKDAEGNVVHVSPISLSDKMKGAQDAVPGFIRGWFGHPLSWLVRKQIERATSSIFTEGTVPH